jgi:hypothetical protein
VHAYVGPNPDIFIPNTVSKKVWLAARSRAGNSMKLGLATIVPSVKLINPRLPRPEGGLDFNRNPALLPASAALGLIEHRCHLLSRTSEPYGHFP